MLYLLNLSLSPSLYLSFKNYLVNQIIKGYDTGLGKLFKKKKYLCMHANITFLFIDFLILLLNLSSNN